MPLGRPVEPDEYIQNAISLRCVSASRRARPETLAAIRRLLWGLGNGTIAGRAAHHDQRPQRRTLFASLLKRVTELGTGHRDLRAGHVRQVEIAAARAASAY